MYLFSDYVTPAELTGYVRESVADLPVNRLNQLAAYLPNRPIEDLDYRFNRGGEGLVEAAEFRTWDTPAPFGKRPGIVRVQGELPPISRQIRLSEYERLRLRSNRDALLDAIYDDGARMARSIAARMELARGEALYTGKVVLNENGVIATIDFGRSASHTVTTADVWGSPTADPLTELIAWSDTYEATNGVRPESMLLSRQVLRLMQRNAEFINRVKGSSAGVSGVTLDELNGVLESEGIPTPTVYEAQVKVNGVATRPIPADRVVLGPAPGDPNQPESSELGATLLGVTAESLEDGYELEGEEQPGIVAGTYRQDHPLALFTVASAVGIPMMANPDLTFAADVL